LLLLTLAAGALSLLALAGLGGPDPQRFREPWPLWALDASGDEESRQADQRSQARRCGQAKRQVAQALLDGRLTLPQAVARFRDIDADLPDEARGWRPAEWTEEEWPYRQVLSFVQAELVLHRGTPAQAEWVTRLEAELREHRRPAGAP
jgi:hypothetical protein